MGSPRRSPLWHNGHAVPPLTAAFVRDQVAEQDSHKVFWGNDYFTGQSVLATHRGRVSDLTGSYFFTYSLLAIVFARRSRLYLRKPNN